MSSSTRLRLIEISVLIAVLGYFTLSHRLADVPLCPSAAFFARPCPTCGVTRSVWHLLHGQLRDAWKFNPLGFLVVVVIVRRIVVLGVGSHPIARAFDDDRINLMILGLFILTGLLKWFGYL